MSSPNSVIKKINEYVDERELPQARRVIELNMQLFAQTEYREKLSRNARELLKVILEEGEGQTLPRETLLWVKDINTASSNYDMSRIRLLLNNRMNMLEEPEISRLLTDISKNVIEGLKNAKYIK